MSGRLPRPTETPLPGAAAGIERISSLTRASSAASSVTGRQRPEPALAAALEHRPQPPARNQLERQLAPLGQVTDRVADGEADRRVREVDRGAGRPPRAEAAGWHRPPIAPAAGTGPVRRVVVDDAEQLRRGLRPELCGRQSQLEVARRRSSTAAAGPSDPRASSRIEPRQANGCARGSGSFPGRPERRAARAGNDDCSPQMQMRRSRDQRACRAITGSDPAAGGGRNGPQRGHPPIQRGLTLQLREARERHDRRPHPVALCQHDLLELPALERIDQAHQAAHRLANRGELGVGDTHCGFVISHCGADGTTRRGRVRVSPRRAGR